MNKFALLLSGILFNIGAYADQYDHETNYYVISNSAYTNSIGLAVSDVAGCGLSYRRWFFDKWAFQINMFPYYNETVYPAASESMYRERTSGYDNEGTLSLGLAYLQKVTDVRYFRLLAFLGSNISSKYSKFDYLASVYRSTIPGDTIVRFSGKEISNSLSLGGGIGGELHVWRFALDGMAGLKGEYNSADQTKSFGPSFQLGGYFRF